MHFKIQVVYGYPNKQSILNLSVEPNSTVADAIAQSGIQKQWPEINLVSVKVGIFGKLVSLETQLQPNDRIEIYRPLQLDPKQARRLRATIMNRKDSLDFSTPNVQGCPLNPTLDENILPNNAGKS